MIVTSLPTTGLTASLNSSVSVSTGDSHSLHGVVIKITGVISIPVWFASAVTSYIASVDVNGIGLPARSLRRPRLKRKKYVPPLLNMWSFGRRVASFPIVTSLAHGTYVQVDVSFQTSGTIARYP